MPTARLVGARRRAMALNAMADADSSSMRPAATPCSPTSSKHQAPQPEAQQRGDLRPFLGRAAPARQGRRQHQSVLVRARLVLVHPARRRHDERRRGVLAVLHEVAQDRSASSFFLDTIALCPRARRAADATPSSSPTGHRDRQLLVRGAARSGRELSAARRRVHVHRSGVLDGRPAGDAERVCRRGDGRRLSRRSAERAPRALKAFDAGMRRGPKIFSWFIYRLTTPTFRDMFMRPRNAKAAGGRAVGAGRRSFPDARRSRGRLLAFKVIYYLKNLFKSTHERSRHGRNASSAIREPSVEGAAH